MVDVSVQRLAMLLPGRLSFAPQPPRFRGKLAAFLRRCDWHEVCTLQSGGRAMLWAYDVTMSYRDHGTEPTNLGNQGKTS